MPFALSRLHVEREQSRAEQVVARPEATVEIHGSAVGADVDQPALMVRRDRRPRRDVTGPLPGIVLPRLVAELTGPRNDMELPLEGAGARIVREDVTRDVLDARLVIALLRRVVDDDDAVDDDGR